MSALEVQAKPFLLGAEPIIDGSAVEIIARWFTKTAIVINFSQPYRLLWTDTWRHQVRTRVPDNTSVSLYRASDEDLNWQQGMEMGMHTHPATMNALTVSRLTGELTHYCRIQVGTIVGVVVAYPWELSASTLVMPGEVLWSRGAGKPVRLDALPTAGTSSSVNPTFHVEPFAFWSGR